MTKAEPQDLLELVGGRRGHFRLESGHHGDLWLDLDTLFLRPARLTPFVGELARLLSQKVDPDAVCGPLLGGGLIASAVAAQLDVELFVAEPVPQGAAGGAARPGEPGELFQARYAVPTAMRGLLRGRRIAVVDDVINAASATRATVADLRMAGADVLGVGALLILGDSAGEYAEREQLALVSVASTPNRIWEPNVCPMCMAGQPLEDPGVNPGSA
jgi:orotate phosphoribosyltransferase